MPVAPPDFGACPGFEPRFVTDDDLEDLASFTGLTPSACLERLRSYSPFELAAEWRRWDPKTPGEIVQFYENTDLYIWDLMQWHASSARRSYWDALVAFAGRYPPEDGFTRVYDFCCGVGTDALFLASRGYQVTAVDVAGPAFRFAAHRFHRRGMKAHFVSSNSSVPTPESVYDAVVCFDVFEHLPAPLDAASALVRALRPGGVILQTGSFDDAGAHPCHLSSGIHRFRGIKWHIELCGLGLLYESPLLYRKIQGWVRLLLRFRYLIWRGTGLWLVHPSAHNG